jgi:hypothetical protein
MNLLSPSEVLLEGNWVRGADGVVADATAQRIESLLADALEKVAESADGWRTLYRDLRDGRFWELTYPRKEWHGGGPPRLSCVSADYAKEEYPRHK